MLNVSTGTIGSRPLVSPADMRGGCSEGCSEFTQAREPLIGPKYETGLVPRVLFVSLDPPEGGEDPEKRTAEAMRSSEKECNHAALPKSRHWYRTHEFALRLLEPYVPGLQLDNVCQFFAHTNSAKCSTNQPSGKSAHWKLFENCREFLAGEIDILSPDIIVTQGDAARVVIQQHFRIAETESLLLQNVLTTL